MKIIARILLTGNGLKEFLDRWNQIASEESTMRSGALALDIGHPDYGRFMEFYHSFANEEVRFSGGAPHFTAEYSEHDLRDFELIEVRTNGFALVDPPSYKDVFVEQELCPKCHATMLYQSGALVIGGHSRSSDIVEAQIDESPPRRYLGTLVSERLQRLLAKLIPQEELDFLEARSGRHGDPPLVQLKVTSRIGDVVAPSEIITGSACDQCGRYFEMELTDRIDTRGKFEPRRAELCFRRHAYQGQQILRTSQLFGPQRWQCDGLLRPILISQQIYRELVKSRVKGLLFFPAHLV